MNRSDNELEYTVVVPTRDGAARLPALLEALDRQRDPPSFELVVADDGSRDDSVRVVEARPARHASRVVLAGGRGPAAARNLGLAAARGRRVAFLGDDTVPDAGWLREHDVAWRARGAADEVAVLGHIRWHERLRESAFLRFLNDEGLQFGFALIGDPERLPFNFFYTSNVSLDRERARREPFDEGFPYPAWEDIEAAYRMQRAGLRLIFHPAARVAHDHPTDFARFCQRQERAGYCAVVFYQRHPELGPYLGLAAGGPPPLPSRAAQRAREALVRALQPWPVAPRRLWRKALRFHYVLGLRRGWSAIFGRGDDKR